MMKKIEPYLYVENIEQVGHEGYKSYYRIRSGKEKFSRLDMFHIPMDKRQLIKSYRYSISGYPCLYLSTGLELCWFECGMPKEFCYTSFKMELSDIKRIKLINFATTPVDLISSVYISYMNHTEDSSLIDMYIVKYLVSFPLRVACSIEVLNRNVPFVEEYIFPQQLLLWVRENEFYDGIAYRTSSAIEKAREWNYFNVVLPAKELEDGYCKKLSRLFIITEPIKVEMRNLIKNHENKIEMVQEFTKHLEQKYYHGYSLYPYREMLSLCKTFLLFCNMLISDVYENAEAIYQVIDTLNLLSYLIVENGKSIKVKAMIKSKDIFYGTDEKILGLEFENTINDFSTNVKPAIFEFWDYIGCIGAYAPVDYNTYKHVL